MDIKILRKNNRECFHFAFGVLLCRCRYGLQIILRVCVLIEKRRIVYNLISAEF